MSTDSGPSTSTRTPINTDNGGDEIETMDEDPQESSYNDTPHGKSRYGRMWKFKSNDNTYSPQNSKMPKSRRQQNTNDNGINNTDENNIGNSVERNSDATYGTVEGPPLKIISPCIECDWLLGQLAWARVGYFPFWPCMVTLDPASMTYYKLQGVPGRRQYFMIHVRYFGDNGRHSWVSARCMMRFTSLADFKKLSESVTAETKKKDPRYAAAFVVKQSMKAKWENAVDETTEVQPMTIEERVATFAPKTKATKSKNAKSSTTDEKNRNNKRKHSIDQSEPDAKRAKHDVTHSAEKTQRKSEVSKSSKGSVRTTVNGKTNAKSYSNSLPSSPSTHKASHSDSPKSVKVNKGEENAEDGVFEVYYARNKNMLQVEYPHASKDDIIKYLRKTWKSMKLVTRKKYRTFRGRDSSACPKSTLLDHEDETSIDVQGSAKENKKAKRKRSAEIDGDGGSPLETKRSKPFNLFKGTKQEKVCQICEKTGRLTRCKGPCYSYFHLSCVKPGESSPEHSVDDDTPDKILDDLNVIRKGIGQDVENENDGKMQEEQEDEMFKCIDCLSGVAPACFICNEREGERVKCSATACGKYYHSGCLKTWPQSHWQGERLTCPYHLCHTCSSDNPQDYNYHSRTPNDKIVRCVRCPSSYHTSTSCLPAGTVILTGSQIICPKHYEAPPVNAAWCFLCTRGGSLICCDTCPTSFHLECLGISKPAGAFICEDCETGRLPLYGEIVWVKLGKFRWWPSRICYPSEIPERVDAISHRPGTFCVMFLGSNDYYWVHRGRAFLYQDGDENMQISSNTKDVKISKIGTTSTTTPKNTRKKITQHTYRIALREANKLYQQLKMERSVTIKVPKRLKPASYVKLKVNKPVGNVKPAEVESIVACDCDVASDNPCAPGTDCLNRILLVECSPDICPAGSKCMNQSFVLRQYPAMEPFHTAGRGWGLKALQDIKVGQFVIEYVGEVIDEAEYKRRLQRKMELKNESYYFLTIDQNRIIDAEPKGNLSRFMNHSCAPNCETQKWTVNGDTRIGLFALRDIKSDEELTFNYNLASNGETRKPCLCGASNCSGFIGLKAQKQQLPMAQSSPQLKSTVQSKKIDKVKQIKRSRKPRCWRCGREMSDSSIEFVVCQQRTCNKKYHKTCVEIDEAESKFICPWHHCLECGRRTSAHCSLCSTAFCQAHIDGNLFERKEKGVVLCKGHENEDLQKSVEDEKEYSDNGNETDKECSSTCSNSPIVMEKIVIREPSPRVSIVEVQLSGGESEESLKEEEESNLETNFVSSNKNSQEKKKNRLFFKFQTEENQTKSFNNLTCSQLEAIIGGRLIE